MRDVAAIGFGLHPWGKFNDKSVGELCRFAVEKALADAGVGWREVQAVAAASSRFSGGKGWGLNGNDIVEDMGSTGIPVYNLSAGCAAGANAFNIGWTLVASGAHDVVLVVGGEKMPKGFIQTSGNEEKTDPEFVRQRMIGMPGPAFWALSSAAAAWPSSAPPRSSSPRSRSRRTSSRSTTRTRASATSSPSRR
jgi:acetyl-CoA acetyltransferase